jgi:hypothetical protein
LQCHLLKKYTKFWEKGFEIIQNIEDRATLQKHVKRARDPVSMATINSLSAKSVLAGEKLVGTYSIST